MTVSVALRDLGKFEARLARQVGRAARGGLAAASSSILGYLNRQTAVAGITGDTGAYRRGWRAETRGGALVAYNAAPHAIWVELGRRAGKMPPSSALAGWAARQLGDARLAFVVARAIGRRGIRGRPVMLADGALARMAELAERAIVRHYDRLLEEG